MVSIFVSDDEDEKFAWDTPTEVFLVTLALLAAGTVVGGWYTLQHPYVDNRIYDLTHGEPNYTGGKLVFTEGQRSMVNKVYSEVSDEYGWCLRIDNRSVEEVSHFASLEYTTEENISFSCYTDRYNGIMHTHPGPEAVAKLSEQDEKTLRETEWIEVSCVVAGEIPEDWKRNPPGISCFTYSEEDGIRQVDVVFDGESRTG